jgi:hypothetical protein
MIRFPAVPPCLPEVHRKKVGVDALQPLTEAQRDSLALIFCDRHK